MFRFISLIVCLVVGLNLSAQNTSDDTSLDSIQFLRTKSKNKNFEMSERIIFAKRAVVLSKETSVDSTILKSQRNLAYLYLITRDYEQFRDINYKNIKLAYKLNDSISMAIVNNSLGWYHYTEQQNDSAYQYFYKATKLFSKLKKNQLLFETLINMADIQETEKDYIGSEATAIRAIKLSKTLPETEKNLNRLWIFYNLLGVISGELHLLDDAIDYHHKALEICNKMDNGLDNRLYSNNNMAFIYRKKEDYKKSLTLYEDVLKTNNLFNIDPPFYALILDNIAYTRFLLEDTKTDEIEHLFNRAYKISDSVNDTSSLMAVSIDMSKYYRSKNQMDSALYYANKTYTIAKETNTNNVILESLLLKSNLEGGEAAKKYLSEHIKLSDSLLNNERAIRNKFAKIEFETKEIELQNEKIAKEKQQLMIFSGILIITLFLLYIIITQRAKNKELQFIQQQQETNEEIYNLMLSQQDKIDEGRAQEKRRISEELHDGILGRLFGTRLSLDSLNLSTKEEAIQTRSNYIKELKAIEQDIRKVSHDLNTDFVSGSGYKDIIKTLIETQTAAYELKYSLENDNDINWDDISNKTKIHFYRIIQESLQNIYKHANANSVKISFQIKNNVICLTIVDDGSGFELSKARKGIGIKNITSRAKEIKGELEIKSEKDLGTSISIKVPI